MQQVHGDPVFVLEKQLSEKIRSGLYWRKEVWHAGDEYETTFFRVHFIWKKIIRGNVSWQRTGCQSASGRPTLHLPTQRAVLFCLACENTGIPLR